MPTIDGALAHVRNIFSSQNAKQGAKTKLGQMVSDRFEHARRARLPYTTDASLNYEFFEGNQWLIYDAGQDHYRKEKSPPWKRQVTADVMFNATRVIVARDIATDPMPKAMPTSNDEASRMVARGAAKFLTFNWKVNRGQVQLTKFAIDRFLCGGGWMRSWWDKDKGEEQDVESETVRNFFGDRPALTVKTGWSVMEHVSWFEVFPDPNAIQPENMRWVIHAHPMHVDAVWEQFGVKVDPMPSRLSEIYGPTEWNMMANIKDTTIVLEYWQLPSADYPKGCYWSGTFDGIEFNAEDSVGILGRLPFRYCQFFPNTRGFHGNTPFTRARPMQHELNVNISMVSEARNLSTYGKWIIAKGSGVKNISTAPGEEIEYSAAMPPPKFVEMPGPNPTVVGLTETYRALTQYVLGVTDSSMGDSDGASQSGRQFAFAAEEDRTKQKASTVFLQDFLTGMARDQLLLFKELAPKSVKYTVEGKNAQAEVESLELDKVSLDNVSIAIESNLPDNKEARRSLILQLRDAGIISDDAEVRRLLEFPVDDSMYQTDELDRERARSENAMLRTGPQPVYPHENHVAHMEEHLPFMKQREWYEELSDEQKAFYLQHLQQHAMMMQPPAQQDPMAGSGPQGAPSPGVPDVAGFKPEGDAAVQQALSPAEQQATATIRGEQT